MLWRAHDFLEKERRKKKHTHTHLTHTHTPHTHTHTSHTHTHTRTHAHTHTYTSGPHRDCQRCRHPHLHLPCGGTIWHHQPRQFSHFSLRCHQHTLLHHHLLRDPLHLNDSLQHHQNDTHPPHHLPCRKSSPCEIPAMPHYRNRTWISTIPERPMELTSRPQCVPASFRSRTSKGWTLYKFPSGNSSTKV